MKRLFHAPMFWLLLPFAAGMITFRLLPDRHGQIEAFCSPLLLLAVSLLFLTMKLFFWKKVANPIGRASLYITLVVTFFIAGFLNLSLAERRFSNNCKSVMALAGNSSPAIVSFIVSGIVMPVDDGIRFVAHLVSLHHPDGSSPLHGRIVVKVRHGTMGDAAPGDCIRARVFFLPVTNFKTPGTFDYENWWKLRGISVRGYVKSPLEMLHLDPLAELWDNPVIFMNRIRQTVVAKLADAIADSNSRALAVAMLTGEKGLLTPELREAFSGSGLGHLLAVSGLHMAMVALMAGGLVRLMLSCSLMALIHLPVRQIAIAAGALSALLYAAIAGFSPSATRAVIMIVLFAAAWCLSMPSTGLNTLSIAAWILLLLDPFYLFDVSFQFSFTVVFFLIAASAMIKVPDCKENVMLRRFYSFAFSFSVTLVAIFASMPLTAWYFNRIALYGIVANMLALPSVSLILPLLMTGSLIAFILPTAGLFLINMAAFFIKYLIAFASFIVSLPFAYTSVSPPSVTTLLLFYMGLFIALILAGNGRFMYSSLILLLISALTLFHPFRRPDKDGSLRIFFPDVGQGSCQVVIFPDNAVMVMDGGGSRSPRFNVGEMIVCPFLRYLGIDKIDLMVVSHPETDHFKGLEGVIKRFPVGEMWHNAKPEVAMDKQGWNEFVSLAENSNIPIRVWRHDAVFRLHDTKIRLFSGDGCGENLSVNDSSLVLNISWRDHEILLTGDIGRIREQCIAAKWKRAVSEKIEVLAVPHHGSNTSSSALFLDVLMPSYAVIPVGRHNSLGLPRHEVVERLMNHGAKVLRTDRDGTISFRFTIERNHK